MSKSSSSGRNRIGLWFRRTFGNKQGESADAGLESSSGIGLSTRDKVLPVAPTERNETTTALMENPDASTPSITVGARKSMGSGMDGQKVSMTESNASEIDQGNLRADRMTGAAVAASSHRARGRSPATLAVQTSTTARGYRDNLNAQMDVPVVADQGSSGPAMSRESSERASESTRHPHVSVHGEAFKGAHNFVIQHAVMNDSGGGNGKVLRWLARFTMPGAEYNSSARDPPPRCHPNSRLDILQRILDWVDNLGREQQLLWIRGSAAIGKSAIVQTLAEALTDRKKLDEVLSGRSELAKALWQETKLGAALFFSRPNNRRNPALVFPTVAYQLAVRLPSYRGYLEQIMTKDPKILEANIEHQFRTLISDYFSLTREDDVGTFVILLDGLDECQGEDAQITIFTLTSEFSQHYPRSPLVWCIASRPEAHLKLALESPIVAQTFWTEDIPSDSTGACVEVERFLRARFAEIQYKYRDIIPAEPVWPSESALTKISAKSLGHFGFASTLISFIEDPEIGDPIAHLEIVLSMTTSAHADPLSNLHLLYSRILDAVPKKLLPHLKLLLAFHLFGDRDTYGHIYEQVQSVGNLNQIVPTQAGRSVVYCATLFNLRQSTVYAALRKLHSVIQVPSSQDSGTHLLKFHHASFPDYLCDASKSGEYAIDPFVYRPKLWQYSLKLVKQYSSHAGPRPLIALAWECYHSPSVEARDHFWFDTIVTLLHYLLPLGACRHDPCQCERRNSRHIQVLPNTSEIREMFEAVNFGKIGFVPGLSYHLKNHIFDFAQWLFYDAPQFLKQSELTKEISLEELDRACIQATSLSLKFRWDYSQGERKPCDRSETATGYCDGSSSVYSSNGDSWIEYFWSSKKLASELKKLEHDPSKPSRTLLVGKGSQSCVFVLVEPPEVGKSLHWNGSFYFIPYSRHDL